MRSPWCPITLEERKDAYHSEGVGVGTSCTSYELFSKNLDDGRLQRVVNQLLWSTCDSIEFSMVERFLQEMSQHSWFWNERFTRVFFVLMDNRPKSELVAQHFITYLLSLSLLPRSRRIPLTWKFFKRYIEAKDVKDRTQFFFYIFKYVHECGEVSLFEVFQWIITVNRNVIPSYQDLLFLLTPWTDQSVKLLLESKGTLGLLFCTFLMDQHRQKRPCLFRAVLKQLRTFLYLKKHRTRVEQPNSAVKKQYLRALCELYERLQEEEKRIRDVIRVFPAVDFSQGNELILEYLDS